MREVEPTELLGRGQAALEVGAAPPTAEEVVGHTAGDRHDLQPHLVDGATDQGRTRTGHVAHCTGDPVDVVSAPVDAFAREFIPGSGTSATLGSLPHRGTSLLPSAAPRSRYGQTS